MVIIARPGDMPTLEYEQQFWTSGLVCGRHRRGRARLLGWSGRRRLSYIQSRIWLNRNCSKVSTTPNAHTAPSRGISNHDRAACHWYRDRGRSSLPDRCTGHHERYSACYGACSPLTARSTTGTAARCGAATGVPVRQVSLIHGDSLSLQYCCSLDHCQDNPRPSYGRAGTLLAPLWLCRPQRIRYGAASCSPRPLGPMRAASS